jgi:hypothetical protein
VKHALAHIYRWPHGTHVLLGQSQLVSRQTTFVLLNHGTTRPLTETAENWIAPTRDGGYCFGQYLVRSGGYSNGCIRGPLRPAVRLHQIAPVGWRTPAGRTFWEPWVLDGTVPAETDRVVLVHRDGSEVPVPLAHRATGGVRYFAARLAAVTALTDAGPARILALDGAGGVIAAARISRHDVRPLIVEPEARPAGGLGGTDVPFGRVAGVFQHERGIATLSVRVTAAGQVTCLDADFQPNRAGGEPSRHEVCPGSPKGLAPWIETNLGVHVAYGGVPSGVSTLEMILRDGTRVSVPTRDGAYLVVIPDSLFRSGNLPVRLVGHSVDGRVVARYVFSRSRDFPDY